MAISSQISKLTFLRTEDPVSLEKVRWSIRQRLRKQMRQLATDLFDAADDFLFSSGQKGQFGEGSSYLGAMRELRAKQKLFEDRFLEEMTQVIKNSYRKEPLPLDEVSEQDHSEQDGALEQVELDLAMSAMARKATRTYQAFSKQIASLQREKEGSLDKLVFSSTVLNEATLHAFACAHTVLCLPLDVRLVFIKLFEQHFLLNMEKLYLDIISIINNVEDKKFVDKLYASSSAMAKRSATESQPAETQLKNQKTVVAAPSDSREIESLVDQLLAEEVANKKLSQVVLSIANDHWRSVLLLVGVNKGTQSREWQEARHTLTLLVSAAAERTLVSDADRATLLSQLRQGFELIQVPTAKQKSLLSQLSTCLKATSTSSSKIKQASTTGASNARLRSGDAKLEVSISPTGEEILDQEDLDDLAQLLGGAESEQPVEAARQELSEILPAIDALAEESSVQVLIDGKYEKCELQRNISNPSLYTLYTSDGSFCLNRSRLGLAIALREGELQLNEQALSFPYDLRTIIDSSNRTRH